MIISTYKNTQNWLLMILFGLCFAQAQTIDKYSLAVKGTLDVIDDYYAEGIELNLFRNTTLYSVGYYTGDEYVFLGDQPDEIYRQFNLLIGKYNDSKNQKFRFQYQAGIGLFWATLRTDEIKQEIFFGQHLFYRNCSLGWCALKNWGAVYALFVYEYRNRYSSQSKPKTVKYASDVEYRIWKHPIQKIRTDLSTGTIIGACKET